MKRYLALISIVFMLIAWSAGCAGQQPPITGGPVTDYVSLIDNLRAAGATVEPAGDISQPFFSVKGPSPLTVRTFRSLSTRMLPPPMLKQRLSHRMVAR